MNGAGVLRRAREALGTVPPGIVIIDGRSGSGKTHLAEQLARELGADTLHMDDLYWGWDGLAEGPLRLAKALTRRVYRPYDWITGELTEVVQLRPATPLVIEGCGALTRATLLSARSFSAAGSVRSIWLDCPDEVRKQRALARDGDMFRPHWERWAAQENALFAAEGSRDLADVRIDACGD